jgi:branched-chain amino acid transport system ATP-binding protein
MSVLQAESLEAGYHGRPALRDFDVEVNEGEVVAILGPNGAGKTTTLTALAGALAPFKGRVSMFGRPAPKSLHGRARRGLAYIAEDRSVFMELTTGENLRVGKSDLKTALGLFPELEPLLGKRAGLLSGGEQQMLTLARALSRNPKVLLVDELSLGLAPKVVERLLDEVRRAATETGLAVVLVEQHIKQALKRADHALVLQRGRVALRGTAAELRDQESAIQQAYLSH